MDWVTWFSNSISSLAWPSLIFFSILLFKGKIKDLIDRVISIDIAGLKAQLTEISHVQRKILEKDAESNPLVENLSKVTQTITDDDQVKNDNLERLIESIKPSIDQLVKVENEKRDLQDRLIKLSAEFENTSFTLGKFEFGKEAKEARYIENKQIIRTIISHFGFDSVIYSARDDFSKIFLPLVERVLEAKGRGTHGLSARELQTLKDSGLLTETFDVTPDSFSLFQSIAREMKKDAKH